MTKFETLAYGPGPAARAYAPTAIPGAPGIVVYHAWWGLNDDVVAFADRLAGAGFAVLAPDLFGGAVETTIEGADARVSSFDDPTGEAITLAAVDALAGRVGTDVPIATLGFSFGAGYALWAASERDRVAGTVVYYGSLTGPSLARAQAPVIGHFAEQDPYEEDGGAEMARQLRDAGRDVTIHRYPGTGHWFAEPSRDAYRAEAAELAFGRTVSFLRRQLPVASAAPR
jgi:carboxymethylenebutenolidase